MATRKGTGKIELTQEDRDYVSAMCGTNIMDERLALTKQYLGNLLESCWSEALASSPHIWFRVEVGASLVGVTVRTPQLITVQIKLTKGGELGVFRDPNIRLGLKDFSHLGVLGFVQRVNLKANEFADGYRDAISACTDPLGQAVLADNLVHTLEGMYQDVDKARLQLEQATDDYNRVVRQLAETLDSKCGVPTPAFAFAWSTISAKLGENGIRLHDSPQIVWPSF